MRALWEVRAIPEHVVSRLQAARREGKGRAAERTQEETRRRLQPKARPEIHPLLFVDRVEAAVEGEAAGCRMALRGVRCCCYRGSPRCADPNRGGLGAQA